MKRAILINIALLFGFLVSCNENPSEVEANQVNFDELKYRSGFSWINERMNSYEPKQAKIDSIKSYYNTGEYDFYVFGKPSCACEGPHNNIAYFFKILQEAEIPFEECEIWAMNSISNNHPYEDNIQIVNLPAFFLLKNGSPVYSIQDTILKRRQHLEQEEVSIEAVMLESLMEN